MADRQPKQLLQDQKSGGGPRTSQIIAVVTLLPLCGTLLFFAGATLFGTLIGLAVSTPLFFLCSPVLVPTAIVIGLALLGFLSSGALGITGLSSLSWMFNYFRRMGGSFQQQMDQAKRRAQEAAGQMGQKARETGQSLQGRAQEATRA